MDFKKVKHKVGKKLAKAANDTNTDIKSRSINLPSQSVLQNKDGVAVNQRNLTLKVCERSSLDWFPSGAGSCPSPQAQL